MGGKTRSLFNINEDITDLKLVFNYVDDFNTKLRVKYEEDL